MHKLSEASINI